MMKVFNMEKILTISIAAYNVEQYLENTIQTILDADCNLDIEVLIVNDGSTDNTKDIAIELEKKYPECIRLMNKENGGHGSTINMGIQNAQGKYFQALDGDDWVNPKALKALVDELKTCDADMVIHNYDKYYEDGSVVSEVWEALDDKEVKTFEEIIDDVNLITYHMVVFKTNILKDNDIHLDENCFYVDSEYVLLPIPFIETVKYVNEFVYCYRLGTEEQSVSANSRKKNVNNSETVANRLISFYDNLPENISEEKREYILNGVATHCLWHFMTLLLFEDGKDKLMEFDQKVKETNIDIYEAMENNEDKRKNATVSTLRKTNYLLFPMMSKALLKRNER